jgi:hypothetical protein
MKAVAIDRAEPADVWEVSPPGSFQLCANPLFENDAVAELRTLTELISYTTGSTPASGLLLTGSLARGEGAITMVATGQIRWLSDIECFVVFADRYRADFPRVRQLFDRIVRRVNDAQRSRKRGLKIELTPILASRLRAMRPAIFTRELLAHGKLLWGNPPQVPKPAQFSDSCGLLRSDALRLLHNRIIEQLAIRCRDAGDTDPPALFDYRVSKFLVELATSFSLFVGCYRTTYRDRQLAVVSALQNAPVGLDPTCVRLLAGRLKRATEVKLGYLDPNPVRDDDYATEARLAQHLWRWETDQLLGPAAPHNDDWRATLARLRRIEGLGARARDWARLLLRTGLRPNVRLRAFADILRAGSFGNAIYSAGCLLFFSWDDIGSGTGTGTDITEALGRLFDVSGPPTPSTRRCLAERTFSAWQTHLRSAAA